MDPSKAARQLKDVAEATAENALGGWGEGRAAVRAGGYSGDLVGVVLGDDAREVFSTAADLMHGHRLWERFPASVS